MMQVAVNALVPAGVWSHVAVVSDGAVLRFYLNGREVAGGESASPAVSARIGIAPVIEGAPHFGGSLVDARRAT